MGSRAKLSAAVLGLVLAGGKRAVRTVLTK